MKLLAVNLFVAGAVATALLGTGVASASPQQDSNYVACVAQDGLFNDDGPTVLAELGRMYANDIATGVRNGPQEDDYAYVHSGPTIGRIDANWLVNCATGVYSDWGPEASWYVSGATV